MLISLYVVSIILANLAVYALGPSVMPVVAFFLIGLDLTLRDVLQLRLKVWQMGLLIAGTGVLTYFINPAAQAIAVASAVSFAASALADWLAFTRLKGRWFRRSAGSNVVGAVVDSILFPTLAFGILMPEVIIKQIIAKAIGGTVWAWLLGKVKVRL